MTIPSFAFTSEIKAHAEIEFGSRWFSNCGDGNDEILLCYKCQATRSVYQWLFYTVQPFLEGNVQVRRYCVHLYDSRDGLVTNIGKPVETIGQCVDMLKTAQGSIVANDNPELIESDYQPKRVITPAWRPF
jgi:hypothetical protein